MQTLLTMDYQKKNLFLILKARFGKEISSNAYYNRKRKVDSGFYANEWLNFFSRVGFVVNHKRIIDTVEEMLQKDTIKRLFD